MKVSELYKILDELIPRKLSCAWDNDGLMACAYLSAEVNKALVSLDATEAAVKYAADNGYNVLITHHPMIFKGVKNVVLNSGMSGLESRRIVSALFGGVSVMSFHTRLDAVNGGVNDALCHALGFTASGTFGDDDAPSLGRIVDLEDKITLSELAVHVKRCLGAPYVKLISSNSGTEVSRIAVCGGDGKDFTRAAYAKGADVLITGSSGYNMAEDASESGIATIEAGHYYTEAPVCSVLSQKTASLGIPTDIYNSCVENVI